jgi:quercetin dioxygenase-like cupin family protein
MGRERRYGRQGRLGLLIVMIALPALVGSGQQGAQPQQTGTLPNFTGKVASLDASDVRGVRFRYDAGARSYWHAHDAALVLLLEQGRGRFQLQGQKVQEFLPGQPVFLPGGVPHWHGASPNEGLTWVAVTVGGRDVKVIGPVSEDEYLGRK